MGKDFFRTNDIPIRILRREPQPEYPIHSHDFSELVIVLNGHGTHFTRRNSFQVGAGDLFVINGDLAHGYRDLDNLVLINILFDLERMNLPQKDIAMSAGFHTLFTVEPLLRGDAPFASRMKLSPGDIIEVIRLVELMERELEERREGYRFVTSSYFMQLITFLSRSRSDYHGSEATGLYQLGEAISFIERNLDRSVSIAELMAICPLSESSLQRAFRKITGTSALDYQLRKRIDKACALLTESDLTVTEIAYDTGFSDSNYFSRQFRKVRGESPRDFRKRTRG